MGMEESENGDYIRVNDHINEIDEYDSLNERNKAFAEGLLKQADDVIEDRNKEIFKLNEEVVKLNEEVFRLEAELS